VTTRHGADSYTTVDYHTVHIRPIPPGLTLTGSEGADVLSGGRGNDTIAAGLGHDAIDGGDGWDTVEVSGSRDDYRLYEIDGGFLLKGADGRDTLTGVEEIRFGDGSVIELLRMYAEDRLLEIRPPEGKATDPDDWLTPPVLPPADEEQGLKARFTADQPEVLPPAETEVLALLAQGEARPIPVRDGLHDHRGVDYLWGRDDFFS